MEKVESGMQHLKEFIKKHEGLRLKPYKCSAGKLTIGWGRNLDDRGVTIAEAERMLDADIAIAKQDLYKVFGSQVGQFNDDRYTALVDMIYNLGVTKFRKFKKMIQAIKERDWKNARKEALDSKWAEQVRTRAVEVADLFVAK